MNEIEIILIALTDLSLFGDFIINYIIIWITNIHYIKIAVTWTGPFTFAFFFFLKKIPIIFLPLSSTQCVVHCLDVCFLQEQALSVFPSP